ncbi:MAG: hypothetical protein AMXMBFR45_23080 [Gammaproteobacteria bacterium]|nr:MAG: CDP-6-deoxy-delta-3,4-glucoseen reductase [Gammaproteobacteria bacterium]
MASREAIGWLLQDSRIWQAGRASAAMAAELPTGWPGLDQALGGGWPLGQLTELLVEAHGTGEFTLLLPALRRLVARTPDAGTAAGQVMLVAPPYIPYAPALAGAGLDPVRFLVVRSKQEVDTLWAMEQALRSRSCAVVAGWADTAGKTSLRRLQLAAEPGNTWVLLFRAARLRRTPSPAPLRIHFMRECATGPARLHVLKRRGGPPAVAVADIG